MSEENEVRMKVPYFQVPNKIFDVEELGKCEKLVYMYLARCGNQGSKAFPSYKTIADKCSMSRRKAIDAVKELKELGLVEKQERKYKPDTNKTNLYWINTPSECGALGSESHAPRSEQYAPNKELINKELLDKGKVYGRKQVSHSARFTYEEIRPQLNIDIQSNELIQYFVDRYEFYRETEHPRLTVQQWNRVAGTFNKDYITAIDEMDREKFIDINKAMINNYYQTSFGKEVDYCILHFIEPQILLNQWRKFN